MDATVASFTPGLTGNPVNTGHWSETPHFHVTMDRWLRSLMPETSDEWRRALLCSTRVRYLIFSQKRDQLVDARAARVLANSPVKQVPSYLRRVPDESNRDADVFEVIDR